MDDRQTRFSPCRRWRYTLWREWDGDLLTGCADDLPQVDRYLMVIGLNPSTADETRDDPTIRRCIGFAQRFGFGALCMTNLFGWRDTQPAGMRAARDPVGPENDRWLAECAASAGLVLAAWGRHGRFLGRDAAVLAQLGALHRLHALKLNADGTPMHPLYVPGETEPVGYPV